MFFFKHDSYILLVALWATTLGNIPLILLLGDQPISYEKAKGYFARDPA